MDFYIDTANLDDIKKYNDWGVVDGVTTNPSLIAKEGVSLEKRIKEIIKVVDGPISTEVIATDSEQMIQEARKYATWHDNIVVKIPMTIDGMKALKVLAKEGIKVNVTLVFSPGQALIAAKNGAAYVSPFVGRLDDISEDGMALIHEVTTIYQHYNFDTKVIVASVRHPRHVIDSALMGADIATIPAAILEKLFKHPLTDKGVKSFLADWEKVKDKQ
ncbi:fructose-6-phosphate aldolase [Candidatus Peregrinibacteria bacterium]|nr:fructose-6-phosphate aldolase [Candidatus Peregrinibacteria bacterium]